MSKLNPFAAAIGVAVVSSSVSFGAIASNPFQAKELPGGYQLADADTDTAKNKMAEGKCGEGVCGNVVTIEEKADATEEKDEVEEKEATEEAAASEEPASEEEMESEGEMESEEESDSEGKTGRKKNSEKE